MGGSPRLEGRGGDAGLGLAERSGRGRDRCPGLKVRTRYGIPGGRGAVGVETREPQSGNPGRGWGPEARKVGGGDRPRDPGAVDVPTRKATRPPTPRSLHPVAGGSPGRPCRASAPRSTRRPYLSSLAVITPSSLGMSSAAVTASWCPSILLSSTGRLLCGLEWISAAMFAQRRRRRRRRSSLRAAHQLMAGRGPAGFALAPRR